MEVKEIIEKCEKLYNDLELSYVKKFKENNHKKAIGFLPVYVPKEIIHACGILPVGLMGAGSQLEIIKGDAYFQSYICHIPRSTIELGLNKQLDCLDGFLFPSICDVIRNLSGMWQLLFKDKYVKYLDLPQNLHNDIGGEFYKDELRSILNDLSGISNCRFKNDLLTESMVLYNENRRIIMELYNLRVEKPHVVPTSELYLLMRASNILEVKEHTELLKKYLSKVILENRPKRDNINVVLTGAFCEQPPLSLIRALENSGCNIIEDDWVLGARFITKDIDINIDPYDALSDSYLHHTIQTPSKYEENGKRGSFLIDRVRRLNADGVIFAAPSFCDPALLERPMLQKALNDEKIPFTSFKYAEDTGQFQVIKEQTGTFADSIKLWEED